VAVQGEVAVPRDVVVAYGDVAVPDGDLMPARVVMTSGVVVPDGVVMTCGVVSGGVVVSGVVMTRRVPGVTRRAVRPVASYGVRVVLRRPVPVAAPRGLGRRRPLLGGADPRLGLGDDGRGLGVELRCGSRDRRRHGVGGRRQRDLRRGGRGEHRSGGDAGGGEDGADAHVG
jgi:hypothetical protein